MTQDDPSSAYYILGDVLKGLCETQPSLWEIRQKLSDVMEQYAKDKVEAAYEDSATIADGWRCDSCGADDGLPRLIRGRAKEVLG